MATVSCDIRRKRLTIIEREEKKNRQILSMQKEYII